MIISQVKDFQFFKNTFFFLLLGVLTSVSGFGQNLIASLQTKVSNGKEISMINDSVGFAAVSGAGTEISGGIYKLEDGIWKVLFTFPYSDDPQIKVFNENSVFALHHLVHFGHWKYVLYHFDGKNWNRIDIPLIHWDEIDYVIIKDMDGISENNLWLVGQKAAILHYKDKKWTVLKSPFQWKEGEQVFTKDFRAVKCLDENRTLVVGNGGMIIEYVGETPKIIQSPVQENWKGIVKIDRQQVILFSEEGSIYKWNGKTFTKIQSPVEGKLIADLKLDESGNIIVSQNNNLYRQQNDGSWEMVLDLKDTGISIYDFSVTDPQNKNLKNMFFISTDGIYKTTQKGIVNFRDVSRESGITSRARLAQFFDANNDGFLDIFLQGEFSQPDGLLLNNGNGVFTDYSFQSRLLISSNGSLTVSIGDIDNDDDQDIITLNIKDLRFHVFRNQGDAVFSEITEWSHLEQLTAQSFQELWGNSMQLRDIDFDGDLDLLVTIWGRGILVFENNGIGQFQQIKNPLTDLSKEHLDRRIMGVGISTDPIKKINTFLIPYNIDSTWILQYSDQGWNQISRTTVEAKNYTGTKGSLFLPSGKNAVSDIVIFDKNNSPVFGAYQKNKFQFDDLKIENYIPSTIPGYANAVLNSADFDLNSEPDIIFPRHLYLQNNHRFTDNSESNGISNDGYVFSGDYDNDGDADILVSRGTEYGNSPVELYKNQLNSESYVKVLLHGIKSNSQGIGSRIEIYPDNQILPDSILSFWNVGDGVSYGAAYPVSPISLTTKNHKIVSVKIIFQSGETQIIKNVQQKSVVEVTEFSKPIALLYSFYFALVKLFKYLIWWQELLKLSLSVGLVYLIFRFIQDATLKNIYSQFIWWIPAIVIYAHVYFFTVQTEVWKNIFLPPISGIAFSLITISIYFLYSVYVRTNYIGPYKIISVLGEGSAGKVYLADSPSEKQKVAVKIYHERIFETKEGQTRFQREVATGTTLKHPNIVNIVGSGTHGKCGFIVMEYVEGENLRSFLTKEITVDQILVWGIELANSLAYIHQNGMLHRDIKTENIMVMPNNHIKVMDLGLAKVNIFATMTQMGTSVGTLAYMSPQQAVGMPLDITSDLYSLGVVLYELLTAGTLPITAEHDMAFVYNIFNQKPEKPSKYNDQIDEELDGIILKCIAKQPEERYQSEAELIAELEKWRSKKHK